MSQSNREQIFAQYAAGALSGLLARIEWNQCFMPDRVCREAVSFAHTIMAEHDRLFPEPIEPDLGEAKHGKRPLGEPPRGGGTGNRERGRQPK